MTIELLLGLTVGIIMALTGAGGGILAVPLLIFGAQLSVSQAAPVALLAVGLSAALGALLGLKNGILRYKAALLMAVAGMLMAPAGVWLSGRMANEWLSLLFAVVLLFVAARTFKQARQEGKSPDTLHSPAPPCVLGEKTGRFIWNAQCARVLTLSGAMAGLLAGLLGVGGGFVMVPALKRFTGLPMHSVIATSLAVIALVSVSGVSSSVLAGTLDWEIALPFAGGALGGMLIGRMVSSHVRGARLQQGFAVISAIVAISMIFKAFY